MINYPEQSHSFNDKVYAVQGPFEHLVLEMAVIFGGASLLGTLFVWLKQPIILAYIGLGMLIGPQGLNVVMDDGHIEAISTMGIILLMFLLGLHLHPRNLLKQLKQTALVTFLCLSAVGAMICAVLALLFGFPLIEALIAGLSLAFSSTVLSLKLIPTTTLHHKRTGEVMISILLFEDILAILTILILYSSNGGAHIEALLLPLKTCAFALGAWSFVRYILLPLMGRFDIISEYIFLVSLGWCLTAAQLAESFGLSHEIGAFIAGVSIATSPISLIIAEGLKPLREFFLILFFFSVGAQFEPMLKSHLLMAILLTSAIVLIAKPILFKYLLKHLAGERNDNAAEMGLRLGQSSEFSLLLAYGAMTAGRIQQETALLIEGAAILTFIVSTYLVVFRLPTPISPSNELRSD
ncbi:cation:proton antiporter [Thalassotalea sp. G20_0]|uniref:cation:proton antiporter n=1 Tax=Thalassotalea sp. G20_0 TaxID=2821093 RepID=UPI001ADC7752|nr:cation:proton antiporter [Thalassotalea sp. G20_0]MBO9492763.1 cation:proton antiporter [Thalassotalea sp. G20_0]